MRIAWASLTLLGILAGCASPHDAAIPAIEPPMLVAIGDSITTAANVGDDAFGDNPGHSWSTGGAPDDGVTSHYERLVAQDPAWTNRSLNVARSGARMSDFARQAQEAVAARATYVTILLGGNDACAHNTSAMTSVETFAAQFRLGADLLKKGLPSGAIVYVASIPNATRVRDLLQNESTARGTWARYHACPALLGQNLTDAQRDEFRARIEAYDDILAHESAAYGFATDGGAVRNTTLLGSDVSTFDDFHPSLRGQQRLADLTWNASPLSHRTIGAK